MAAQTHAGDAQQDVPQRYLNVPAPPTLPGMKQKRQVLCRLLLKGHCHYGEDCTFAHDWSTLKENSQENPNGGPSRCARTGKFSRWESKGGRHGKIPNAEYCAMTAAWALKDWCNNRHIPEWVMPGMVIAFQRHGLWFLWHLAMLMKDQVQLPLPCEEGAQPNPLPPNAEYCAMTAAWALKDWCNNRHIPEWVMPGMVIAFQRHGLWFLWHLAMLMKDQVQLPLPCEEGAQPNPLPSCPKSSDGARLKSRSRSRVTDKKKYGLAHSHGRSAAPNPRSRTPAGVRETLFNAFARSSDCRLSGDPRGEFSGQPRPPAHSQQTTLTPASLDAARSCWKGLCFL